MGGGAGFGADGDDVGRRAGRLIQNHNRPIAAGGELDGGVAGAGEVVGDQQTGERRGWSH